MVAKTDETKREDSKERFETEGEIGKASAEYTEKTAASEKGFGERIMGIFSKESLAKVALLEALELMPFLAGYSVADLYVAGEGLIDVFRGVIEKDLERLVKGGMKIAVSAVPGLPVAGIGPVLDRLLPNKERSINEDR